MVRAPSRNTLGRPGRNAQGQILKELRVIIYLEHDNDFSFSRDSDIVSKHFCMYYINLN